MNCPGFAWGPDYFLDDEWRTRGKDLVGWLEGGNFVVQFGNDNRADWRGTVHST